MLDACRTARVLNNIFVNNYAATLLGQGDVEISANRNAEIDYNVYFRHPGKDKLLRGLPYAEGVDLAPLAADNPFGLRLRLTEGKGESPTVAAQKLAQSPATVVFSLAQKPWAEKFDAHSQSLDILQRFTGPNSYTRSYEDLFRDFQQEDFRPRFTSPAVGRGADLTAEVAADVRSSAPLRAASGHWPLRRAGGVVGGHRRGPGDDRQRQRRPGRGRPRLRAGNRRQSLRHVGQGGGFRPLGQPHLRQGFHLPRFRRANHLLARPGLAAERFSRPPPGLQPLGTYRAGAGRRSMRGDSIASAIGAPSSAATAA